MKKIKVLFFLPSGVGGAEKMTVNIAKMLDMSHYEVKFVLVDKEVREIINFIPSDYKYELLKIRNIWDFTTCRLVRIMRREKPDIVFCSLKYLNPRVILAARIVGGIKVIVRNDAYMNLLGNFTMKLIKFTYPKADIVIAQTDQMRKEILSKLPIEENKVVTLHNPVDAQLIKTKLQGAVSPYTVDGIKYVATSRINPTKGQDTLIEAFSRVYKNNNRAHLFLIGLVDENDSYYLKLLSLIKQFKMEDNVHFPGFTDNPYKWLKFADCFVLASRREGLPNTLIEASYIGIPTVATQCLEIIDEIVNDGYNGFVVPVDDVESMSEAMLKAINLKNFSMTYKQATKDQFLELF